MDDLLKKQSLPLTGMLLGGIAGFLDDEIVFHQILQTHDLKHTFGRRLRAAGVSGEDRQDLLGHKNRNITTHYSAAEIGNLIKAANKVCERSDSPTIASLKKELCQLKQVKVIRLQSRGGAKMTQAFGESEQRTM